MFDIFDDMDDFALDFDMASESYYDSIEDEYNEWEDAANEAVGYDAIKDKVDDALESFKEGLKMAGKLAWSGLKKAAAAVKAFFKALPGRIAKFIRQGIEKIKQKIRTMGESKESSNARAARLAEDIKKDASACNAAATKLFKYITVITNISRKKEFNTQTGKPKTVVRMEDEDVAISHAKTAARLASGIAFKDTDSLVNLNEEYKKYNKVFNASFSKVLGSAIGYTKALVKGNNARLTAHYNSVTSSLNTVCTTLGQLIDDLGKAVTALEMTRGAVKATGSAILNKVHSIIFGAYRETVTSFTNKKDRIEEQMEYIKNAYEQNERNYSKGGIKGKVKVAGNEIIDENVAKVKKGVNNAVDDVLARGTQALTGR